ncbi:MAG: hypothetical protein ACFCVK_05020 [Acidimicrobiales bacterium]
MSTPGDEAGTAHEPAAQEETTAPVLFLSDEWLAAADQALAAVRPLAEPVRVGYRVTGGPAGTSTHRLILGPDRVGAERSDGDDELALTLDWDLAVAINRGEQNAQQAFLDGRIQIGGDPRILLGHQVQLAEIDDRLASLRARTTYLRS